MNKKLKTFMPRVYALPMMNPAEVIDLMLELHPVLVEMDVVDRKEALDDALRIKQNHINLRDTYIEELEGNIEALRKNRDLLQNQCTEALMERELHHILVVSELLKRNSELEQRALDAESGYATDGYLNSVRAEGVEMVLKNMNLDRELYASWFAAQLRADPAVSLAELVPPERNKWEGTDEEGYDIDYMEPSDIYQMGKDEGFNLCRAAIMRNIDQKASAAPAVQATKPVKLPYKCHFGHQWVDMIKIVDAIRAEGYKVEE